MLVLRSVLESVVGIGRSDRLFDILEIAPALLAESGPEISRAGIAQALNMLLFEDLLERVPAARTYASDCGLESRRIMHDHGAVRTVALEGMGDLPAGQEAITRILRPLGYALSGVYPLERLKMTGRSHAQVEFPEEIAQFFISELHPERFSPEFQAAVRKRHRNVERPVDARGTLIARRTRPASRVEHREGVQTSPVAGPLLRSSAQRGDSCGLRSAPEGVARNGLDFN